MSGRRMDCGSGRLLRSQLVNELTESVICGRLAAMQKDEKNRIPLGEPKIPDVMSQVSGDGKGACALCDCGV